MRGCMRRKVFSISLLIIALLASAWSTLPSANKAISVQPKLDQDSPCARADTMLVGRSADLSIKHRINDICDFKIRMDQIPSNVSDFDKEFIKDSITSNTLELQLLQIALSGATNEEWRGQIQMMILMHTSDLQQAIAVAKKIGVDTTSDLTNASVYPQTPDYDLGIRTENLIEQYVDPLKAALPGGGTVTPTGVPTDTGTAMPSETATAMSTETATSTMTSVPTDTETMTSVPTDTVTMTSIPTDTATMTSTPTDTATATSTGTVTAMSSETMTPMPSETMTAMASETMTAMASETSTAMPSDTATAMMTGTAMATATTGPTVGTAFDILSLNIIEDVHTSDVQSEMAAERLVVNDELKAFAKHSADVTELHLLFMSDLKHRMVDNYTPPPPELQADYQSPRRIDVNK